MDSSGEADRAVQPVVSPSLLDGLLDSDLLELSQIQWDLGVEGFDTPPPLLTREESDEPLLLASQQYESDGGGAQPLMEYTVGNRLKSMCISSPINASCYASVLPSTHDYVYRACDATVMLSIFGRAGAIQLQPVGSLPLAQKCLALH